MENDLDFRNEEFPHREFSSATNEAAFGPLMNHNRDSFDAADRLWPAARDLLEKDTIIGNRLRGCLAGSLSAPPLPAWWLVSQFA